MCANRSDGKKTELWLSKVIKGMVIVNNNRDLKSSENFCSSDSDGKKDEQK